MRDRVAWVAAGLCCCVVAGCSSANPVRGPCRSDVHDGLLPPWARAGFSDPKPRIPYVLGRSGRITAILFAPLNSPPAADHNNKILWVPRPPRIPPQQTFSVGGRTYSILYESEHLNVVAWTEHGAVYISRVATPYGHDLRIQAQRMTGTKPLGAPVSRSVTGGPGPSIINLPSPGCWRLSLQWSRWTDTLDLQYKAPG